MGQFYGWERPLYFGKEAAPTMRFGRPDWFDNVRREVAAAHQAAALFDASPFGKIEVEGPDAQAFLLLVCAGHVDRAPGSVIYTAVLNERGTYESDITVQRLSDTHYRLFVGTAAIKRDLAWLRRHAEGFDVSLADSTGDYAVLGLMGPHSARIAETVGAASMNNIGYFRHGDAHIAERHVRAARLSYVGEAGWEITCRSENAPAVYAALVDAGARPAGLYAQASMRIEKGFCAMGHELDSDVSPIEVGLAAMTRKSGGFIGAEALDARRSDGVAPRIISLLFDDEMAVPLGHEPICLDGQIIGETASCAFGYRVGKPVALAYVRQQAVTGTRVEVDIARDLFSATVRIGPLFDPDGSRMRG